jgi:hypothetical protein
VGSFRGHRLTCTPTLAHLDKCKAVDRAGLHTGPVAEGLPKPPILCRRPLAFINGNSPNVFREVGMWMPPR